MAAKQRLGTGISGEYAEKNDQAPSVGNDIVNKTYADSLLAGTITLAEDLLLKSFFAHNGFLLNGTFTTFKEEVYDYPTPDYQNLGGGSLTKSMSQELYVSPGTTQANWGWNLGAAKGKILAIITGRPQINGFGIGLSSSLPSAAELPVGSYYATFNHSEFSLYKIVAGPSTVLLSTITTLLNGSSYASPTFSLAFYYDDATDRLIVFARVGPEMWFPVLDITDSSFTTFQYVSVRLQNFGVVTQRILIPLGIYHS